MMASIGCGGFGCVCPGLMWKIQAHWLACECDDVIVVEPTLAASEREPSAYCERSRLPHREDTSGLLRPPSARRHDSCPPRTKRPSSVPLSGRYSVANGYFVSLISETRIERALMDCVAPLSKGSKGGDAIHQCPRADFWLLRGIFDRVPKVFASFPLRC